MKGKEELRMLTGRTASLNIPSSSFNDLTEKDKQYFFKKKISCGQEKKMIFFYFFRIMFHHVVH
jgi:hypothetical protein